MKIEFWEMSAGPNWSSRTSVTTRSEKADRSDLAVNLHLRGLRFDGAVIVLQRHRRRAGILGDLKPLGRQHLARLGEREVIIVAQHPLHFHQSAAGACD